MQSIVYLFTVLFFLLFPVKSKITGNASTSNFSKDKFFIKTKTELKISEATGKIMLPTGIESVDESISKYGIKEIRNLFRLDNGSSEVFYRLGMNRIYVCYGDPESGFSVEDAVKDFDRDANIEYGEPNYIGVSAGFREIISKDFVNRSNVPNDEMFFRQWYLQNTGSVSPSGGGRAKIGADIKILNAWDIETGDEEVIVAILDSGIKDDHPDFYGRIWINKKEIPGNGKDDDFNGYVDDYKGWDFAYDDRRPDDGFGHGTNIATVIGASTNNKIGFSGIDMKCRLMNCKNLNDYNSGEYAWWAKSIKYAVDNGADIINMSEGGDDFSKVLKTAVEYAQENDVLIVAAMMNKGDGRDYYPASYNGVFAVGATDTDDRRCKKFSWGGGSCWGKHISVVAPGNRIYGLDFESDDNYEVYWSGTSQSTAIVSAISSLLKAQDRMRSADEIKRIIKLTAKDMVGDISEDKPGWDKYYGYGRVDSYAALSFDARFTEKEKVKDEKIIEDEVKDDYDNKTMDEEKDDYNDDPYIEEKPAKALDRKSEPENSKPSPSPKP